jgi:serine/threonine-protein kinase
MPEAIAHYKILEPLGSGGIGEVYRARDTKLGRTVAVKVLSPAILSDTAKFDALGDVAQRLTKLSHPNIAMLFDGGQEGDRYYLVFEFVQGQPLASLINGRPLQVRRALEFTINLADALAEGHSADLIHGDIRPDTIMITPKDRAKFMNFGLAPFTGGGASRLSGNSPYVAPEELAGNPADARSDIYSLGAVMYFMLSGQPPFMDENPLKVIIAHASQDAVPLRQLNPSLSIELEEIVMRCLEKDPDHRYQDVAALQRALKDVAFNESWSSDMAAEWWSCNGCPERKKLAAELVEAAAV